MAPKRIARKSKKTGKKVAPKKKGTKKKAPKKTAPKAKKAKGAKKKAAPKAAKPTKPKPVIKAVQPKGKYLTKSELMTNFCAESGLDKKQARTCFESLTTIGQGELAKGRKFVIPGMARFVVKKKAATKAREGINPFTQQPCVFAAKPARKIVKAYVVKAFKDL